MRDGHHDIFLSRKQDEKQLKKKKKAYDDAMRGVEENALVYLSSLIEGRIQGMTIAQEISHFGMTVPTYLVKTLDLDVIIEGMANSLKVKSHF